MYQRYYGGNMDEGWTRFVLEDSIPLHLHLRPGNQGRIEANYDAIILPDDTVQMMTGDRPQGGAAAQRRSAAV